MKPIISIFCLSAFLQAHAQTVYLADTALVTDVGFGGAPASCKTNGMIYNSVNMDRTKGIWVADVFTIPPGATWVFDTVIVFGYQLGSNLTSPFIGCNLQIYNGTPGVAGTVVWGDTTTNVLNNSGFTGIYKVDTFSASGGLLSTTRPIMFLKLYLSSAAHLNTGTYWLSWSATCASGSQSPTTPYKVLSGRINPPGQMSRVYANNSWNYIVDNGNSVGFNMIIKARQDLAITQADVAENKLEQNVPNPFSHKSIIAFSLATEGNVRLVIYDVFGRIISTLVDGIMTKGNHQFTFDANNLPSGNYYCKLSVPGETITKQMNLIK